MNIDLNCDLGESFGNYRCGEDDLILPLITSANVACGFHASDPGVMAATVKKAADNGVRVGAHPGFPDLQGFGRRNMNMRPEDVTAMVQYQIGALSAFCHAESILMQHVKPHGALYNMAVKDAALANAICLAIARTDDTLILMAPAGSQLEMAAANYHLRFAREIFADRAYMEDGTLVPRTQPGAVIHEEAIAIERTVRMVTEQKVTAITGKEIAIVADTICIHGDNPSAVNFAQKIRQALINAGIALKSLI